RSGIPFDSALKVIESNLGKNWNEVFASIDEEPIGTASIGVVYRAALHDGQKVVVKIRRPHIAKTLLTDFEILLFIVQQIEKVSTEIKFMGMSRMISDFFKSTENELNFL